MEMCSSISDFQDRSASIGTSNKLQENNLMNTHLQVEISIEIPISFTNCNQSS